MQTFFGSPMGVWTIVLCVAVIFMVLFCRSLLRRVWRYNKKHHIIAFNDHSVDSLYAWDEDDDI